MSEADTQQWTSTMNLAMGLKRKIADRFLRKV